MPTPEEILAGLSAIANEWRPLAILWHGYFTVIVLGLFSGLRLTARIIGLLLILPLLSVGVLAWIHGNPFNGVFFSLTGIVLLAIALRLRGEGAGVSPMWFTIFGVLMIAYGWVYPHFLNNAVPIAYLYSAPTGLVPCPTLAIVIGFTLVLGGLRSRAWCLVLSVMGLFYGVFGAVRLGVKIDWILFFGALSTAYAAFSPQLMRNNHGEKARYKSVAGDV